jgi:calcium/calmodulin-dependent protein kinase I
MSAFLTEYDSRLVWLGRGRHAVVYQTEHLDSSTPVAMKIVSGLKPDFDNEFALLKQAQHPNVIRMYDCFKYDGKGYLILQLCRGGSLMQRLREDGEFSDIQAARVVHSVLSALDFIHRLSIIHRDVKADNIMYLTKEDDSPVLLGDFGLAKLVSEGLTDTRVGTKGYQAPQIVRGHVYNHKCDIWSVGVVAYEILHGKLPFNRKLGEEELYDKMMTSNFAIWDQVSPQAADFIRSCLRPEQDDRPEARELLKHPWLAQFSE